MILAAILLHFAQVVIAVSVIGTHWSNDGLTIIFANAIGDPLLVDFTLLTVVTTEQLTLIQP